MSVQLYNLAPALELMGVGLLVAGLPFAWFWRQHRQAGSAQRLQALTWLTLALTFELVLVGAFTRLTDSGLGCPDWPGCYGSASPLGAVQHIDAAQTAMPTGPVTHGKAWMEMVHRYMATSVGVLIIVLSAWTWRVWRRDCAQAVHPLWPTLTLFWVCLQGAFGAWTVTLKLFPAIVTLHLLGGLVLLVLLARQVAAQRLASGESMAVAMPVGLRWVSMGAGLLLLVQILLGGWVSTNYAVLACSTFPQCQGSWWPVMDFEQGFSLWRHLGLTTDGRPIDFEALTAIHYTHRLMAYLVLVALGALAWCWKRQGLQVQGRWLNGLLLWQWLTGLSNVLLDWPLLSAVAHTGGAAALLLCLSWTLFITRTSRAVTIPSTLTRPLA